MVNTVCFLFFLSQPLPPPPPSSPLASPERWKYLGPSPWPGPKDALGLSRCRALTPLRQAFSPFSPPFSAPVPPPPIFRFPLPAGVEVCSLGRPGGRGAVARGRARVGRARGALPAPGAPGPPPALGPSRPPAPPSAFSFELH